MAATEITLSINGVAESAVVECSRKIPALTITMASGLRKTYTGEDIYICFGLLRKDFKDIKFLCKGAKLNVHPSSMSSQMSNGIMAYELTLGKQSKRENLVNIFDYEENDITNEIQEQIDFYDRWIDSLVG